MSFDGQRDVVDRLDKIERHLAALVALFRELMGKPPNAKGWSPTGAEKVRREFTRVARLATARRGPHDVDDEDPLPIAGGTPPEEVWSRHEPR